MDRREFFKPRKKIQRSFPEKNFRTLSGIDPYTGSWTTNEVQHLLKRVMFGSTKADIDFFKTKSLSETVNILLNPVSPLPPPPVNDYNNQTITDPGVPAGQTWVNTPTVDGTLNGLRNLSFKKWWVGALLNQDRSIREKMSLFWANHFGTETNEIITSHYIYQHHALLRSNALGDFKSLVKSVTVDPGMLRYLNGYLNTKNAPDENYARELQELFTIGKDPVSGLSNFTEYDIKLAAKILSGWRINNTTWNAFFDASKHDSSNKQFSSFYNNTTITGKTGTAGAGETDELIDMIFLKNEVAAHICRNLYRWFVYYKIDTATENNLIQPLADIFRSNNYEIKPVLSALFQSEHFFDVLNQGCLIKSPADLVIGTMREYNVLFPDIVTEYADAYGMYNYLNSRLITMTQNLGDPPGVAGWPSYYQAPQYHEIWINSDTLPKRNVFTDTFINTGFTRNGKKLIIDTVAFAKTLSNPADPNLLIDDALAILFRVPLSSTSKQALKQQILLSGQVQDYYWTDAWNLYIANPTPANLAIVNTRLKSLFQNLMNLAEYQLS